MIFPENQIFKDFFTTLNNRSVESNLEAHILFKGESAIDNGNVIKLFPSKSIYVNKNLRLSLKGVQQKIGSYLSSINHVSNIDVVNSVIYMLSFIKKGENIMESINNIFKNSTQADLNQFLIFPLQNGGFNLELGEFHIGTVDKSKIKRYCEKFNTDYYQKYSNTIDGKFGITRKHFSINMFNTEDLANSVQLYDDRFIEAMFQYFDEVSKIYQENFYSTFSASQELMNFLTSIYYDPKQWSIGISPSNFISIYLNIAKNKNQGWIVPKEQRVSWDLGSGDVNEKIIELKENYNFESFEQTELDLTFKKFISFCAKGSKFKLEERTSESFLHFIIALDLLLGDKDSNTQTISKRTAFLTFRKYNIDFERQVKLIKDYYNKRSKYVHEGLEIDKNSIDSIKSICLAIFECFLKLHKEGNTKSQSISEWIAQIDLGIALVEAGQEISSNVLLKCGIE